MYHVGILGGGASGMMAAVTAACHGARVSVLEHTDRLGRKILSTGNGKCNFTNLNISEDDYFGNHPSFVTSALSMFGPQDMVLFLEKYGILTQEKRGGYCYPYAGQAAAIRDFFLCRIKELEIDVRLQAKATKIQMLPKGFEVSTQGGVFCFDRLILACGGKAAPLTGSDGSAFSLLEPLALSVHKLYPTLAPLFVKDRECNLLAGVRANGRATLKADGEPVCQDEGEIQFNKESVSGIPIFQLTHDATKLLDEKREVTVWVDFLPHQNTDETRTYIAGIVSVRDDVSVGQLLGGMVHKKIVSAILQRLKLSESERAADLKDKQLKKVVSCLHQFVFTVVGHADFSQAQATRGGVSIEEMDENMMVKKVPGMYIVGEMLDIDGKCGGYNLQWAWTSGYIAGTHAAGFLVS